MIVSAISGVDTVDHSLYPDEEFRRKWISVYLNEFHGKKSIEDSEVQLLVDQVEMFSIASHFFWGVWAVVQAANSSIPFDFIGFVSAVWKKENTIQPITVSL